MIELNAAGELLTYEEYFPYGGSALIAGKSAVEVKRKEYRYSGKEKDVMTGLYYYGARYYPAWLARWINPDPAGTIDGLNLYAFVGGNPTSMIDESGNGKRPAPAASGSAPAAEPRTSGRIKEKYEKYPEKKPKYDECGEPRSGNPRTLADEPGEYLWSAAVGSPDLPLKKGGTQIPHLDPAPKVHTDTAGRRWILSRIPRKDILYYRPEGETGDEFTDRDSAVRTAGGGKKTDLKTLDWKDISAQSPGRSKSQGQIMKVPAASPPEISKPREGRHTAERGRSGKVMSPLPGLSVLRSRLSWGSADLTPGYLMPPSGLRSRCKNGSSLRCGCPSDRCRSKRAALNSFS